MDTPSTTQKWPESWSNIEGPVVPLERILYGHTVAGLLRETQFEEALFELLMWKGLFQVRGSGMTILPITISKEIHWNPPSRNWS